jgi:ribosomal protein L24E
VLYAAGDIARCPTPTDAAATANIIKTDMAANPNPNARVAMLGDGAYPGGAVDEYNNCYGPTWGQFLNETLPTPGNHDYGQTAGPHAPGYVSFFGNRLNQLDPTGVAANDQKGWYSTDLGAWHFISLNWWCKNNTAGVNNCAAGSEQVKWLQADLARTQAKCMIAIWHSPRFFSAALENHSTKNVAPSSDSEKSKEFWKVLQAAGADVVLGGHQHLYERFDKMSSDAPTPGDEQGTVDPNGMRQFVVGTGGGELMAFNPNYPPARGSQVRYDNVFGVLKLTLHETSYDWQFIDTAGTVRDSGSDVCRTDITPTSNTTATTVTTQPTNTTPTTAPASQHSGHGAQGVGYWMVGADGKVYAFGKSKPWGNAPLAPGVEAVDLEPTPSGNGYWIVDSGGGVYAMGDAKYLGGPDSLSIARDEKVTSLSATPSGNGYWIFTSKGRVLTFGDAGHFGDMAKVKLNGPVLDSIPTPSGQGYYMVASDGGIFAFGDAKFYGSMGDKKLNAPVQSLVPDADGVGYWLVASDGGIFAFESAFKGSMGDRKLNRPVTGMVRFGDGYLMVAEDGGIFNFSSSDFYGSLGSSPPDRPIVSVAVLEQ